MADFPGKGMVAVLKTTPGTVLDDIHQVMRLAGFEAILPRGVTTGPKINIPRQTGRPACPSTPMLVKGILQTLRAAVPDDVVGVRDDIVVVDTCVGELNDRHRLATLTGVMKDPSSGQVLVPASEVPTFIRRAVGPIALAASGCGHLQP